MFERALKDEHILLVQDSLRLLPEADGDVNRFANENGFTEIIASTNLVSRIFYENDFISRRSRSKTSSIGSSCLPASIRT